MNRNKLRIGDIVELLTGEHEEIIGLTDSCATLSDNTDIMLSDIAHILSDEEIADLIMDRLSDI